MLEISAGSFARLVFERCGSCQTSRSLRAALPAVPGHAEIVAMLMSGRSKQCACAL